MTPIDLRTTVAAFVVAHPESARVFQAHRIDFCCHGDVPLEAAVPAAGSEARARLLGELAEAIAAKAGLAEADLRDLPTRELVSHIVARHHAYLRRTLPFLVPLADKVGRVHGEHDPRLEELARQVKDLEAALGPHLDREEAKLFPALLARRADRALVRAELDAMFDDHIAVGAVLARARDLTDDYTTPAWGCGSYRALMGGLEELEGDILRHVHLENHLLMPRFA